MITFFHQYTLGKTLENGVHQSTPWWMLLLSKKNLTSLLKFAKQHLDVSQDYLPNILWTNETKIYFFERNTQCSVWRKIICTTHQRWNLIPTVKYGGGPSWFGAALLLWAWTDCRHCLEKRIPKFIKTFCRKTEDHLSANWTSAEGQ